MLSEYQLEKLLEAYEARMQKLTDEYIEMMGNHLKEIGKLKASDIHRLTELKRVGINAKAIQKKLVAASNKSVSELNVIFKAVAENDQRFAQQWFSSGYEPEVKGKPQMSKPIERVLKAQLRITAQEFKNLSRTTIQTEAYRNAVDVAIQSVQACVQDYKSAIRRAMKDAAEVGLRVKYPTGVTRRFDTAARQNILDGVREINNDILRQLGNEYGADGVEISAHALCAEDHLPYQGKQFTNKEFERIQNSLDRPFGQWNCKHTIYPIILGVSERANDDDTLEKYRTNSSELITIDGKTKSRYDWSQEQRKVETAVRTQKDIANLAKASGDDVARREAQAKINSLKEYYTRISDAAGLEADKTRMTVAGFRAVKALTKSEKTAKIKTGKTISAPIEHRNTGKGSPSAILHFDRPLNKRQTALLEALPEYDSRATVKKGNVNMRDLAALTAKTGVEYAMFTRNGERMIVRGNSAMTNISVASAADMANQGWRWSGHTHPGADAFCLQASDGDYAILAAFQQRQSVVFNSSGQYLLFGRSDEV